MSSFYEDLMKNQMRKYHSGEWKCAPKSKSKNPGQRKAQKQARKRQRRFK